MMQLTLNVIRVNSRQWISTTFLFLAMLNAFPCQSNGWNYVPDESDALNEGDACKLRNGDAGVCKRIETCEPLIEGLRKRTIEYKSLVRCTFIGPDEIICCPVKNQPPTVKPPVWLSLTDRTVSTSSTTTTTTPAPISNIPITTTSITTTTTTPSTTTTTQRLVIGNITLTGKEQFIDLSKLLSQKTTKMPQTPLQPIPRQPTNVFRQPNVPTQFGRTFRWPNQNNRPNFVQTIKPPRRQRPPNAEWYDPIAAKNVRAPSFDKLVQRDAQLPPINLQNNPIHVITDQFAMFEFRPDSDDSTAIDTNTQRTNTDNDINNHWVWQLENISSAPTTDIWTTTTQRSPILPTISTQRSPILTTGSPILDDWMLDALKNFTAMGTSTTTTTTTTTTPVPVPITVIPVTKYPDIDIRIRRRQSRKRNRASTNKSGHPSRRTPVPTTIQTVTTRNQKERPAEAACRSFKEFNPASLTFHILDGLPVLPGEYPHMGGLLYEVAGGSSVDNRCGSSLISERYALTAAHCVNDPLSQPSKIRFGVVIWSSPDDSIPPVDADIESITLHPDYRSHLRYHDLALIKLTKNVEFSPFIRPACLYSNVADIDSSIPLVVIGWGVTNVQTRARSEILLMTNVTTVPLQECNATHVNYGVSRSYKNGLNEGHYCAYDPELKKDACQSDSGGPLHLVENKLPTIVGVVSFGLACGSAIPSIYARVAFYLDWIESVVWPS